MKHLLYLLAVAVTTLSHGQQSSQSPGSNDHAQALVDSRHFRFIAESANPMRGRTIFLSAGYEMVILPDSIIANFPYYGRAYQAPMNPNDAGIRFTSTDFDYSTKARKNGWDITIKPKDVDNSPLIYLSVTFKGHASLRITSSNRQPISFNGHVRTPGNL